MASIHLSGGGSLLEEQDFLNMAVHHNIVMEVLIMAGGWVTKFRDVGKSCQLKMEA